jgi:hypothetical protein
VRKQRSKSAYGANLVRVIDLSQGVDVPLSY